MGFLFFSYFSACQS